MVEWPSVIGGFLIGVATGACSSYFANKYTDRRREKEAARRAKQEFLKVREQMPALMGEMKADLSREGQEHIREIFVLDDRRIRLGGSKKERFVYFAEDHGDLHGKLSILENMGYVIDVTPGNTPIFRMTEGFVELVRRYG